MSRFLKYKWMPAALVLTVLLLTLSACGQSEPQGPDAAVQKHIELLNSRDFGAAYDSLAGTASIRRFGRDEFIEEMQKFWGDNPASMRLSELRFEEVAIEGDAASVSWSGRYVYGFKGDSGDAVTATSVVILEDGEWKVEDLWGDPVQ